MHKCAGLVWGASANQESSNCKQHSRVDLYTTSDRPTFQRMGSSSQLTTSYLDDYIIYIK